MGAGASYVAAILAEELRAAGYQPRSIKASKLIEATASARGLLQRNTLGATRHESTAALQDAGDALRRQHGPSFVAGLAIREIHQQRSDTARREGPLAFIIDSLKHPREVEALRQVYRNAFYLISVICGPEVRYRRLHFKYKEASEAARMELARRDESDPRSDPAGQNVRGTIHQGDFFVNNEAEDQQALANTLRRIIQILTGQVIVRPERDERGMHAAWVASLRSSCLSRQVGAAILDEQGELIATGTNDVPRFGGGLYEEGGAPDHRCFVDRGSESAPHCRNDLTKRTIYSDIFNRLKGAGLLAGSATEQAIRGQIEQTAVGSLVEFSRAVHAEMDALLSLARTGGVSARGATLYCTTYPCHNCARHIVASGIREVIYIEPYTKSRAIGLHSDSILETTQRWSHLSNKVHFRLFSGVAPRRFPVVFHKRQELKDRQGMLIHPLHESPLHQDPVFARSLDDFERQVAGYVTEVEAKEVHI